MRLWMSLPRGLSPTTLLVSFLLIVGSAIFAIVFWHNWVARAETLARAERNITNLSNSLAQHASRTIEEADLLTSEIVERVENGAISTYQLERLNRHMAERVGAVSSIRELIVLSENGHWVASSLATLPRHNNADREYFKYHKEHLERVARVSSPILSRATGRWTILISRRVDNSDGTFGGVVAAAIDADYFQRFYNTLDIGQHGTISLMLRDGRLLVRRPFDAANLGKDISRRAFFNDGRADAPSGFTRTVSPFDGRTRLAAYQRLPEFPLLVWVALDEREVLAPWRQATRTDTIVATSILLLIAAFGFFTIAHLRNRQQLERAVRDSEQRYRLLANNAADIVVLLDFDGTRRYVSPSVVEMLGYTVEEYMASTVFDIAMPEQHAFLRAVFQLMSDGAERHRLEYQLRRKDGEYIWVETTFKLIHGEGPLDIGLIAVIRDISSRKAMEIELQDANTRLKSLAATDFLTGIANRRSFDLAIEQEGRRSARSRVPLSVLLIDIDNFKAYNDHFGHSRGDECLKQVAQALNRCTQRPGDLAARYGGEEFSLILPNTDEAGAEAVAQTARREIEALRLDHPESKFGIVTISVGVASRLPDSETTQEQLLDNADAALYRAKALGRNRVVLHSRIIQKKQGQLAQRL